MHGQHYPHCNERCIGNRHHLLPWQPDPMRHQTDRDEAAGSEPARPTTEGGQTNG